MSLIDGRMIENGMKTQENVREGLPQVPLRVPVGA